MFSSSLDGTVRAYDMFRYRNFRTFTDLAPSQFSSLAVEPTGDVVCAGTSDSFHICVWSVNNSKLLDVLEGHTANIPCLEFNPTKVSSCCVRLQLRIKGVSCFWILG